MKITDQLSKEIVAACEGEIAGIVTNAYTDAKLSRIRGYKASNDDNDEAKLLPLPRVIGDGEALIVKNLSVLKPIGAVECPLGAKVYDSCGTVFGVLRDVTFDGQSGKVLSLTVDEKEIMPERVVGFGKKAVVLRAPSHETLLFKRAPSKKRAPAPAPAPATFVLEQVAATESPAPTQEEQQSLFPDYAFLLGRTVLKTITGGETVVAEQADVVTPDVILRARENGKLVELTVNSRK